MVMANKISRLPMKTRTTCRSCWAMAPAISALPTHFTAGYWSSLGGGGRFQWRRQTRPGCCRHQLEQGFDLVRRWDRRVQHRATLNVGIDPYSVVVGDFNGDGKQDLATANNNFPIPGSVSILLRDCALTPTSVVSRKPHGSTSVYDIDLPVTGATGIECRSGGATNDYTIIATFLNEVTFASASVTSGNGMVSSAGGSGTTVATINITGIANGQTIAVSLHNVSNGIST